MHSSHPIHRALVTFSNSTTGEIRVKIPALLGADSEVAISYIGRKAPWAVPTVGDQIVVTSDDTNLTNVFWVQTDNAYATTVAYATGSTTSASATYAINATMSASATYAINATMSASAGTGHIPSFNSATARASAIPSPTEGMLTYLKDVNSLWVYNGTTWAPTAGTAPRGTRTGTVVTDTYSSNGIEDLEYLRFYGSGVFTCTSAGFCDIIVTGGGGGGGSLGGGGGGGQVVEYKQMFLNTGTYTVFIGAGGAGGVSGQKGSIGGTTRVAYLATGDFYTTDYWAYAYWGGGGGGQNAGTPGIYGDNGLGGGGGHSYSAAGLQNAIEYGGGYYGGNGGYSHTGNPYKGGGGGGSRGAGTSASVYAGGDGGMGLFVTTPFSALGVFGSGGGGSYHGNWTGFQGRSGDSGAYGGRGHGTQAGISASDGFGGGGGGGGYLDGTYYAGGKGGNGSVLFLGVNIF